MAIPETTGIPTELPSATAPTVFQNDNSPLIAATRRLGVSLVETGDYFTRTAADDAFNNYQKEVGYLMRGNPRSLGPDGQPGADMGYLGLNGRAALDRRPTIEADLDSLEKRLRDGLGGNQRAIDFFDNAAKGYRTTVSGQISSHADTQSTAWSQTVNAAGSQLALDRIAANPLDPETMLNATSDLIGARIKTAQLAGALPGDEVWNQTMADAKRDALKTQILSVGATDPSRAMDILTKNKDFLGSDYASVHASLRERAEEQDSITAGTTAIETARVASADSWVNPANPVFATAVTETPGGFSADALARVVQIESAGNPDAANGSHVGLGQFSEEAAKEVGLVDRKNPEESIKAIQRYAANNAQYLTPILGRAPTDAELYLAHQQGPGGAAKLLSNPTASAVRILGGEDTKRGLAIVEGNLPPALRDKAPQLSAAQFVQIWMNRFRGNAAPPTAADKPADAPIEVETVMSAEGAPMSVPKAGISQPGAAVAPPVPTEGVTQQPFQPVDVFADAMAAVQADDTLSPQVKQRAIAFINNQKAQANIASKTGAAAKAEANDQAVNEIATMMASGQTNGIMDKIKADPRLSGSSRLALINAVQADADRTEAGATAAYGNGFWAAYQGVTAEADDPTKITSVDDLMRRAGPGGDLTLAGVQKLGAMLTLNQKTVGGEAITSAKAAMLRYAKSKLSFQDDAGYVPDFQGETIFNARFIPKFEAAFDKWTSDGKDPWEFLNQENVDKMLSGLRSPREMAMARLMAQQSGVDVSALPAPPTPAGVDEQGWKLLVNSPPLLADGKPSDQGRWLRVINTLIENPTPAVIGQFDQFFAPAGLTAQGLLDVLGVEAQEKDAAPSTERLPDESDVEYITRVGTPLPNSQYQMPDGTIRDPGLAIPVQ